MSALLAGAGDRIDELKQLTRELNLHVPPSSFASKVSQVPYEQALAPMLAADTGPLHLYVGVPLCEEHCRFCMYFYGLADASGADAEECVASMETFLAALAGSVERPVAGMYVGGGTPTVLSAEQIRRLLAAVNGAFEFEPNSQQTFEMSPRSFSPEKARAIAESGVHRVSFGLQSFDPEPVRRAGRGYVGPEAVGELIRSCLAVGIDEINADLMVGLDGESDDSLSRSVEQLLDLGCPTISIYRYRQARKVELDDAGGLDAYVATCAGRVERAVEIARSRGREVSGRIDGEHIRLVAPGEPRWEERNLYETRYRPRLRNSLVGVGSGARSFLRDEAMVHCAHRAADGFGLLGRPVEVEECDEEARASAALVNALFREFEVDLDELARQESVDPMTHFGSQLDHLVSVGVLIQDGQRLVVAPPHRGEWAYWDKLLYPPVAAATAPLVAAPGAMTSPLSDGDEALVALPAADLAVAELVEFAARNADWHGERFAVPPTAEAWAYVLGDVSQRWYGIVAGELAAAREVLGIVVFTRWSGPPWRSAEIGFGVDRTMGGRGLIQASVPEVLRRHLGVDLQRVEARVHPDNGAAARSLARLGFSLEGRLRGSIDADGGRADQDQWAIVAGDELTPSVIIADQAHDESSR